MPWSVYNLSRFDEPVLLSTNDGNTLLGANCDLAYHEDVGGWDLRCLGPLEPGPDASPRSAERREAAVDYIADHPGRVPVVVAARVGRLLDVYGLGSLVTLDVGEEKARWTVLGRDRRVVAARRRQRGRVAQVVARPYRCPLVAARPCCAVVLTAVHFYGAHRIRAPVEPAVVLLAAVEVAMWSAERRRWGTLTA